MNDEKKAANPGLFAFLTVSFIYLLSKWISFKGFNGTDDLHYAMLAGNVLKGTFNPFESGDIFAGRVGLIYTQALVYFIGGIHIFTTQIGTLVISVLCCYLTVVKLGRFQKAGSVLIASSLFYFNPVLNEATLGVMPDAYVMLAGIIILLLWRNIVQDVLNPSLVFKSILVGLIVFGAMFFKENALIYIPFLICAGIFHKKNSGIKAATISVTTFGAAVFICGCIYYYFTGDFFFRMQQVQNSNYLNPCNYALLPSKELVIRLTYGVWKEFITASFYPVILAAILILGRLFLSSIPGLKTEPLVIYFIMLFILGLYFPFSFKDYQPLCFKARHFIFLYPPAIVIVTNFLEQTFHKNSRSLHQFVVTSFILLMLCIITTGEKWYWMMYGLFFGYFIVLIIFRNTFISRLKYLGFAVLLWIYMPYQLFFQSSDWFKDLSTLPAQLKGNYFYFPEHDNMSHFKLLHHFDTSYHIYNIEPRPFQIFNLYYEKEDTVFHPGWFIVNKAYTLRSPSYLKTIDKVAQKNYFSDKKIIGDVSAYYVSNSEQFRYIKTLTASDGSNENNCCN